MFSWACTCWNDQLNWYLTDVILSWKWVLCCECPSLTWIRSKILSFCHFVSSLLFCCRLHHQCLITDPFQSTFSGKEVEEFSLLLIVVISLWSNSTKWSWMHRERSGWFKWDACARIAEAWCCWGRWRGQKFQEGRGTITYAYFNFFFFCAMMDIKFLFSVMVVLSGCVVTAFHTSSYIFMPFVQMAWCKGLLFS